MPHQFPSFTCFKQTPTTTLHPTPTSFRQYLVNHPATSSKRNINLPHPHRLTATPQGGDCFFHALSWSLKTNPPPQSLRQVLSTHVRKQSSFYATALLARALFSDIRAARNAVSMFTEQVVKCGVCGHWLGSLWGELEILAVARCFGVCIQLFTFDVRKQAIRLYFDVQEGKHVVRMLFTGRADAGHFDALLPIPSFTIPTFRFWKKKDDNAT